MDAQLVLDRDGFDPVPLAERAVGVHQVLRRHEQRQPLRTLRRIGRAREHEVHDVLGDVVVTPRDEDLLALDRPRAVAARRRDRADRAEVGARSRLGQVHRAGPLAAHELGEVRLAEFVRRRGIQGMDLPGAQQPAQREGGVRGVPDLAEPGADRPGQSVAARRHRSFGGDPAGLDERRVCLGEPGRQVHLAVFEAGALAVADLLEGGQHRGGELARARDDVDAVVGGELATGRARDDVGAERLAVEEGVVGDGRLVVGGHGGLLGETGRAAHPGETKAQSK